MTTYTLAKEFYASRGIDTEAALQSVAEIPLSIHCWQGDDVAGFENAGTLGGGLAVTGGYPGRARTADELRADLEQAFALIPGPKRLGLHALYAETNGKKIPRDEQTAEHYANWIAWAKASKIALDHNPSFFAHPNASSGLMLTHPDPAIRNFWIRHGQGSRRIAAAFTKQLGVTAVNNVWTPDGMKDTPFDRAGPRARLLDSLDQIFAEKLPVLDAVESKLFGVGCESYTAGSHEFYTGYAVSRQILLCLDAGHFHPTETLTDKITALLPFVPGILLHLSRGVRWDSDHVTAFSDDMLATVEQSINCPNPERVHFSLDYFDASINRVAAWVIGGRNVRKAMLAALLQPRASLAKAEAAFDYTTRLALQEEAKIYPLLPVWDEACRRAATPADGQWLPIIKNYEKTTLNR